VVHGEAAVAVPDHPALKALRAWLRRRAGAALALLSAAACGQRDRPPPDRPTLPTLTVAPDPNASMTGRRVVAAGQISQLWHVGSWSPASITLSDVAAGDAIVVLGAYWGDLEAGASTAPTDTRGELRCAIDQGPAIVGRKKPPVFAQLCTEFAAQPGAHIIVPPYLGGPAGDGTFYAVQIRGLTERSVVTTGQARQTATTGAAIPGITVGTDGDAAAAGDLILAIGGFDDVTSPPHAGISHPPAGWTAIGVQDDPTNNVPSEVCYRLASVPGPQSVSWTWTDTTANVAVAAIAALR
jgi:hypothetical protein